MLRLLGLAPSAPRRQLRWCSQVPSAANRRHHSSSSLCMRLQVLQQRQQQQLRQLTLQGTARLWGCQSPHQTTTAMAMRAWPTRPQHQPWQRRLLAAAARHLLQGRAASKASIRW
jgi:hypothetical protein